MGNNLILIGMPGAGKSTVGVILAKTLGMDFLDTDLAVCRQAGTTLQDFLDREGLDAFLQLEEDVVCGLQAENTVIATGGSVPLRKRAIEHLKKQGRVIYLRVPLPELEIRLSNIRTRGIAFGPGETLRTLYDHRTPIYTAWADMIIETDKEHNDIEHMVESIVEGLQH